MAWITSIRTRLAYKTYTHASARSSGGNIEPLSHYCSVALLLLFGRAGGCSQGQTAAVRAAQAHCPGPSHLVFTTEPLSSLQSLFWLLLDMKLFLSFGGNWIRLLMSSVLL